MKKRFNEDELKFLLDKVKNNYDHNTMKKITDLYISNIDDRDTFQKTILSFIENLRQKDKFFWMVEKFNFDHEFSNRIFASYVKSMTLFYFDKIKESGDFLSDFAADILLSQLKNIEKLHDKKLSIEVRIFIMDVFSNNETFKKTFSEREEELNQMDIENNAIFEFEKVEKETLATFCFDIPIIALDLDLTIIEGKDRQNLIKNKKCQQFFKRIDFLTNDFDLECYLNVTTCNDIRVKTKSLLFSIVFDLNDATHGVEMEVRDQIIYQLQHGFGCSLFNEKLLIDDRLFSFKFDFSNISKLQKI